MTIAALLAFVISLIVGWYHFRPEPLARHPLLTGITYEHRVQVEPEPAIIHIIEIDLTTPGLSFFVTPWQGDGPETLARTTTELLDEFDLDLALSGSGLTPCHRISAVDYYPSSGDPVRPLSLTASRGVVYQADDWLGGVTLYLGPRAEASLNSAPDRYCCALTSLVYVVHDGQPVSAITAAERGAYPRAAVGLNRQAIRMIWVAVDGKQPPYSQGIT